MEWGFFTITHMITLVFAALIPIGLYFVLKKASRKVQTAVLGVLSFSGIAAIIYNLVTWGEPLAYLPLHLCSINALLLPIVVFTRNKTLGNLLLVWCLGALAALIMNNAMATAKLFDGPFCFYYFPHILEFGIPILLFKLGLVEKDAKCIFSTLAITMAIYTLVHFANVGINAYCLENQFSYNGTDILQVNYMYSVHPDNPLLALFYQVIPHTYWYMYLICPILAGYLLLVYLPQLRKK